MDFFSSDESNLGSLHVVNDITIYIPCFSLGFPSSNPRKIPLPLSFNALVCIKTMTNRNQVWDNLNKQWLKKSNQSKHQWLNEGNTS